MKFFDMFKKAFNNKLDGDNDNNYWKLRYPAKPFNGAIVPAKYISYFTKHKRFKLKLLADGNYMLCRLGSVIPKVGTYLYQRKYYSVKPITLAN